MPSQEQKSMIDTREELSNALTEAAELEHGLTCQYLFAAFSMKQRTNEGITDLQLGRINSWKGKILRIAQQEMAHLATVCNLLTAIGGAPQFRRPNFPQPPLYYSPDIAFELERFSRSALKRFVEFERPETAEPVIAGIAPEPLPSWKHVGELYSEIKNGFGIIDEQSLFIGPNTSEDTQPWGLSVQPRGAHDRQSAVSAIDEIIKQGEATTTAGPESHYQIFFKIAKELNDEKQANPSFDPARPVASNPLTRVHRDSKGRTLITNPATLEVAELFNVSYGTMLLMFMQYYSFAGESDAQRGALRGALRAAMKAVIRPLGEILTEMPMGLENPGQNAGPGFELYGDLRLPTNWRVSWKIFLERLVAEAAEADRLRGLPNASPRLADVATALAGLRDQIAAALGT
jgi:Ferritin-like